ncbi:MAG: right-handed parallel beta-helix repeat-containing protein, partial [Planctomycetia bacterium]|nr:right-handed parallel beta-helix repeat-containing protein [Planctomycetia bacterium]
MSVTTVEYDQIRNDYPTFQLSENINDNNIIELTSLNATNLQNAINQATQTDFDDLIVIRTSERNNTIDLQGETLYVNIDSTAQGALNIIGFGDSMLRLFNENLNVIHIESGQVNLGGLNLTTKADSTQLKNVLLTQGEKADVLTQRVLFSSTYTVDSDNKIQTSSSTVSSDFVTAKMPDVVDTNYYSAEFQLAGSQWVYVTGLSQFEAQDIQNNVYNGTNDFYVGEFYDAEKNGATDDMLCWAGTASNMLAYTGWGDVIGNEDDIFDYFRDNFTNDGSRAEYGIEWFMNGSYPAQGYDGWAQVVGTGGNLYPNYDYDLYCNSIDSAYYYTNSSYSPLYAIDQYLRDGCAIGLSVSWFTNDSEMERAGGHAITMWGFVYDDTKTAGDTDYYLSVIVSDSDDDVDFSSYTEEGRYAPNRLQTYGVTWRENEMMYEFNSYGRSDLYFGAIDDFQYLSVTEVPQKPDLMPYTPSGWSGPIVVTNSEDSTTSNFILGTADNIYISYSITNFSEVNITEPFECTLTIDGTALSQPIIQQKVISGLEAHYYYWRQDEFGSLAEGEYTVTLTIDATNVVDEEFENNTATYSFIVLDNPDISLVVDSLEDTIELTDGKTTLREAIAFANSGDTITFDSSLNGQTITLSGTQLEITKDITIDASALSNGITINADEKSRVFFISGGSETSHIVLNGLTITGGNTADNGGGISLNKGFLTLNNCTISGNYAENEGGGIYDYWATLIMTNCTISGNLAWVGGGIYNYDNLIMTNCIVTENSAGYGGGICSEYYLTMTNCTISGNSAEYSGGGVYCDNSADITNTIISQNTAHWGGGMINFATSALTNCTISGNSYASDISGGDISGAIENTGTLVLYNSIVAQNIVDGSSSDIHNYYTDDYEPVSNAYNTLSSFTAWDDGSNNLLYDSSKPLFTNAANGDYTLAKNSQAIDKGNNSYAVDAEGNPLQYDLAGNTRIVNNNVDLGAYEYHQPETISIIVDSLEDNISATDGVTTLREAIAEAQTGDTITFKSTLNGKTITLSGTQLEITKDITIDASALSKGITINANQASCVFYVTGGTANAPVELIGLTLTGGKAPGPGGGIFNDGGTLTITTSTISDNSAEYGGGGIYNRRGTLTVTNSTISGNTANGHG